MDTAMFCDLSNVNGEMSGTTGSSMQPGTAKHASSSSEHVLERA